MTGKLTKDVEIFFSYAQQDEQLRLELEKHLSMLQRQRLITSWHNRKVGAGKEWRREINAHLNTAQIILLLVSQDFIASEYCYDIEVKRALERHKAGEAHVIPIILRFADWKETPIGKLQALPRDGKPITSWSRRYGRDKAFLDVAIGIREVIKELWSNESSPESRVQDFKETSDYNRSVPLDASIALIQTQRGDVLYNLKHYQEALEAFSMAIYLDPEYVLAHSGRADSLYKLRRFQEALLTYNQALLLDPDNAYAYHGKGLVLHELKRYEEALIAFDLAIRLEPNQDVFHSSKGDALKRLRRSHEAKQAYQRARQLRLD